MGEFAPHVAPTRGAKEQVHSALRQGLREVAPTLGVLSVVPNTPTGYSVLKLSRADLKNAIAYAQSGLKRAQVRLQAQRCTA